MPAAATLTTAGTLAVNHVPMIHKVRQVARPTTRCTRVGDGEREAEPGDEQIDRYTDGGQDHMNEPDIMIRARHVGKQVVLPGVPQPLVILADVDLDVAHGERVAIVGESGSGKTTLLGILAGLDLPTSGEVWLAGAQISALDEEARARVRAEHVGFVFQNFQLLAALTALENVMLPLELRGTRGAAAEARTLLERVGLAARTDHYPQQLSGGEQQRVAIARAFACRPRVLFADEPTGNLDTRTGDAIADMLFDLNAEFGTTLVLVTHAAFLAERCERRIAVAAGRVSEPDRPGLRVSG